MHHEFEPDHYHTTIGWHEPVLSIKEGDTVSTTTIDAGGKDKSGEQVSEGGNPALFMSKERRRETRSPSPSII